MTYSAIALIGAALCAGWALVSIILITRILDARGMKTPLPLIGLYVFRNLDRYREMTLKETGKVGRLFYAFIVPVNAAWMLALVAWFLV